VRSRKRQEGKESDYERHRKGHRATDEYRRHGGRVGAVEDQHADHRSNEHAAAARLVPFRMLAMRERGVEPPGGGRPFATRSVPRPFRRQPQRAMVSFQGKPGGIGRGRGTIRAADQDAMARAVILAGGQGTRLRPYTAVLPKPLLPIADRPVLDIIMDQLGAAGFERVTVATGYMGELIEAVLNHRATRRIFVDFVREAEPLGTAGPLATIEDLDDHFLVMNGDVLTDLDYCKLLADHITSDAIATIATTTRDVRVTLGVIECFSPEDGDRLTGYVEKPRLTYDVSMGVYCFSPSVLDHIDPGVPLDLPDLVLRLIERDEYVRAWRSDAYWVDLGRREDYERAVTEYEQVRQRLLPEDSLRQSDLVR
jgi:NDP-mannose synthase